MKFFDGQMKDSGGYLTIIPPARVSNNQLVSNKLEWNNCFIENATENIENETKITIKTP